MATPNSSAMNLAWRRLSPLFTPCICPFLIICIPSYLRHVCHAVRNEKKPIPGLTRCFMKRLVNQIVEIVALPQFTRSGNGPCRFQLAQSVRVGSVFLNRDHTGSHGVASAKQERFPCLRRGSGSLCKAPYSGVVTTGSGAISPPDGTVSVEEFMNVFFIDIRFLYSTRKTLPFHPLFRIGKPCPRCLAYTRNVSFSNVKFGQSSDSKRAQRGACEEKDGGL